MLLISDKAVDKAKEILTAEGKSNWGIRIYCAGESCCGPSFGLDINEIPASDDEILEKDGLKLFLEKTAFKKLSDMQLDYFEDGERAGFILTGAAPSCGGDSPSCGSSCSSC